MGKAKQGGGGKQGWCCLGGANVFFRCQTLRGWVGLQQRVHMQDVVAAAATKGWSLRVIYSFRGERHGGVLAHHRRHRDPDDLPALTDTRRQNWPSTPAPHNTRRPQQQPRLAAQCTVRRHLLSSLATTSTKHPHPQPPPYASRPNTRRQLVNNCLSKSGSFSSSSGVRRPPPSSTSVEEHVLNDHQRQAQQHVAPRELQTQRNVDGLHVCGVWQMCVYGATTDIRDSASTITCVGGWL
jgi:hypothetical protein